MVGMATAAVTVAVTVVVAAVVVVVEGLGVVTVGLGTGMMAVAAVTVVPVLLCPREGVVSVVGHSPAACPSCPRCTERTLAACRHRRLRCPLPHGTATPAAAGVV